MSDHGRSTCVACGELATGCHGIPVDALGDVVGVSYAGGWAGQPACEACWRVHDAVRMPGDPIAETIIVRRVLVAFDMGRRDALALLFTARGALASMGKIAAETLAEIGSEPAETDDGPTAIPWAGDLPTPTAFRPGTRLLHMPSDTVYRLRGSMWVREHAR